MAEDDDMRQDHITPMPGWACIVLGVGFIACLVGGIVLARMFGQ